MTKYMPNSLRSRLPVFAAGAVVLAFAAGPVTAHFQPSTPTVEVNAGGHLTPAEQPTDQASPDEHGDVQNGQSSPDEQGQVGPNDSSPDEQGDAQNDQSGPDEQGQAGDAPSGPNDQQSDQSGPDSQDSQSGD